MFFANIASANAIVPVVSALWSRPSVGFFSYFSIIIIETIILHYIFEEKKWRKSFLDAFLANTLSAICGAAPIYSHIYSEEKTTFFKSLQIEPSIGHIYLLVIFFILTIILEYIYFSFSYKRIKKIKLLYVVLFLNYSSYVILSALAGVICLIFIFLGFFISSR